MFTYTGQQIRGKVIGTTLGSVQCLCFSPSVHVVAAGVGKEVLILDATVNISTTSICV